MIVIVKQPNKSSPKDLYLETYGPHFNKKLCEFAISLICHSGKSSNLTWEQVMSLLDRYKIQLDMKHPYDIYYIANMAYNDYYEHSLKDDHQLTLFIQDYLEDEDGYEGISFYRWLTDMKYKSITIDWENMI